MKRKQFNGIFLSILLTIPLTVFSGCVVQDISEPQFNYEIDKNLSIWQDSGIEDYEFNWTQYWGPSPNDEVIVHVERKDGKSEITLSDSGFYDDDYWEEILKKARKLAEETDTIEKVFEKIRTTYEDDMKKVRNGELYSAYYSLKCNKTYGYPERFQDIVFRTKHESEHSGEYVGARFSTFEIEITNFSVIGDSAE